MFKFFQLFGTLPRVYVELHMTFLKSGCFIEEREFPHASAYLPFTLCVILILITIYVTPNAKK